MVLCPCRAEVIRCKANGCFFILFLVKTLKYKNVFILGRDFVFDEKVNHFSRSEKWRS
jgi:hypothetical protein